MTATVRRASRLPESWRVELPEFEGPLDLLLHLVRVNEVEITELPIALICDQFHEALQLMEELDLDVAAEYIYEAAGLIYLKSRSLLPAPKTDDGDPAEDPQEDLVQRLLEYRKLKEAAQSLAEVHAMRAGMWGRPASPPPAWDGEESVEIEDISLFDLLGALRNALDRYDREHPPPISISGENFSVRDQFHRLLAELDRGKPCDLVADLKARSCRAEVVAAFLAVLELARLSLVRVHQSDGALLLYRTTRELAPEEVEAIQG